MPAVGSNAGRSGVLSLLKIFQTPLVECTQPEHELLQTRSLEVLSAAAGEGTHHGTRLEHSCHCWTMESPWRRLQHQRWLAEASRPDGDGGVRCRRAHAWRDGATDTTYRSKATRVGGDPHVGG